MSDFKTESLPKATSTPGLAELHKESVSTQSSSEKSEINKISTDPQPAKNLKNSADFRFRRADYPKFETESSESLMPRSSTQFFHDCDQCVSSKKRNELVSLEKKGMTEIFTAGGLSF